MYIFVKSQTMNKIQFLVCNISPVFPADINEMIFKKVQENAAESIQKMYFTRVKINLDAFLIFRKISTGIIPSLAEIHHLNNIIGFYSTRIRYSFIQEPGIWIDTMYNIIDRCRYYNNFHMNNTHFIINNVKISNSIFAQTGIVWWENL